MTISSVLTLNKLEGFIISGDARKEKTKRINLYFSVFVGKIVLTFIALLILNYDETLIFFTGDCALY